MNKKISIIALLLSVTMIVSACDLIFVPQDQEVSATVSETTTIETSEEITETEAETITRATTQTEATTTTAPETTTVTTVPTTIQTTVVTTTPAPVTTTVATTTPAPVTTTAATTVATAPTPATNTANFKDVQDNYVYRTLSGNKKDAYDRIVGAIRSFNKTVDLQGCSISSADLKSVFGYVVYNEPLCQYVSSNFRYRGDPVSEMYIDFIDSQQSIQNMEAAVKQKADSILSGLNGSMTDYDKALYIHDAIIKGCSYDANAPYANSPYGCLVLGKAHCQGYSFSYAYLCRRAGIDCTTVVGYAKEEHMWNLNLLNGNWYYTDVTWDDQDNSNDFTLPVYNYFNAFTSDIANTRKIYAENPIPGASPNNDMNYFVKSGSYVKSVDEIDTVVYNQIVNMLKNNSRYIGIKFADLNLYNQAYAKLLDNQEIFELYDKAQVNTGSTVGSVSLSYLYDSDTNYIVFCFK